MESKILVIMYLQAGWKTRFKLSCIYKQDGKQDSSYHVFTSSMETSVDPDQLADKPADLDQHCS